MISIRNIDVEKIFQMKDATIIERRIHGFNFNGFYTDPTCRNLKDTKPCNWYKIDDKWHYFKISKDALSFFNELIGEYLAEYFNLPSIHQKPAMLYTNTIEYGLLSENFRKHDVEYFNPVTSPSIDGVNSLLKRKHDFKSKAKFNSFMNDILKMLSLYFYSNQVDGCSQNILFENNKGGYSLSTLFDYTESFDHNLGNTNSLYYGEVVSNVFADKSGIYSLHSAIATFDFPSLEMKKLFTLYPEFKRTIESILVLNLEEILSRLEREKNVFIPSEFKDYYLEFDGRKKEFVKRNLL